MRDISTRAAQSSDVWHRRLEQADKLRIESRKLRDQWKFAKILSDATTNQEKDESQ